MRISPPSDAPASGRLAVSGGKYCAAMAHFAVRLVHGPGWDPARPIREQDGWDEHAAFMDGLVDDGFLILGGPVGNGDQTLHVIEAAGEQDVMTRLAQDPWARAGLLKVGVIEPWALWLDSRSAHDG
jgi:uncharacterized protein YciI